MTFNNGDKVRVNEGLLEGQTGTVVTGGEHVTLVKLAEADVAFGDCNMTFYTQTLVSADEDHPALKAVKLYPDRLKEGYVWRLTTNVDGLMYKSLPFGSDIVGIVLHTPPAGLYAVECMEKVMASKGDWKTVWQED